MDYSSLTREELVELLQRRDATTPLGIVWERNEIGYDKALSDDFVALTLHNDLSVGDAPFTNMLIEGDNFDALRYIRMTHKGKVKVICIDPPYNTGNKDFIYNDRFMDKDDRFKHSTWLEFMFRRLTLAKELLRHDGAIFVNIGEDEVGHLTMLMDKIFPGMKVGTFVWLNRTGTNANTDYFFCTNHEYVLCYANPGFRFGGTKKDMSNYTNPDGDTRGDWTSGDLSLGFTYTQRQNLYYPIKHPTLDIWYPCNPDRVWVYATEARLKPGQKVRAKTMEQFIREEKILFPTDDTIVCYETIEDLMEAISNGSAPSNLRETLPDLDFWVGKQIGKGKLTFKRHLKDVKRLEQPLSSWIVPTSHKSPDEAENVEHLSVGMTSEGTKLIQQIMGSKVFNYPKPKSLIKAILSQATSPDTQDIVIDFFGGSGTTAHALLELNAEDGGDRRFVVVSSTEATTSEPDKNVCREVTKNRLEKVINGYTYRTAKENKEIEGLDGDFAYLSMTRIPAERIGMEISHEQLWIALQLINDAKLSPFTESEPFQKSVLEDRVIMYVPVMSSAVITGIEQVLRYYPSGVVYAWEPGLLRRQIDHPGLTVEKIPEFLVQCFGGE